MRFHGDYAGVAQAVLEQRHPGATAQFVAGCGADANPSPRGTTELVEAHGTALADAVDRGLKTTTPVGAPLRRAFATAELPFANGTARERWRAQLDIDPVHLQRYDTMMKSVIERGGRLPVSQRDPVQAWAFGPPSPAVGSAASDGAVTLVAPGGEVGADYARRLAREYPRRRMWVAGYSSDIFAYVPSLRVLREGGYEGGDAMIYDGRPAPFTEAVEELIIEKVRRLLR